MLLRMPDAPPADSPAPPSGLIRRLGAAGPVAIVLSFWPPLGGFVLLATLTRLGPWLRDHGTTGVLVYFLLTGFLLSVSFVPTYSCAILAGWAFGFAVGWPLAMVTITVSSVVAYAIGRWIARDRVLDVIREKPTWDALHRALLGQKSVRTAVVAARKGRSRTHAGPPRISLRGGSSTTPPRAVHSAGSLRVSPQVFVDEAATVEVSVIRGRKGRRITLLKGSAVGKTVLRKKGTSIRHRMDASAFLRLRLHLAGAGLEKGRLCRIQIRATDLDGQSARASIAFRA